MLEEDTISKINDFLTLINITTLTAEEIALLNNIACKYQDYKGDCLAIYLACLITRWRGNCTDIIIPKLQMLSDCNSCNINVDSVVNNKSSHIYFGGVQTNNNCC